jgi:hypothetical protein
MKVEGEHIHKSSKTVSPKCENSYLPSHEKKRLILTQWDRKPTTTSLISFIVSAGRRKYARTLRNRIQSVIVA